MQNILNPVLYNEVKNLYEEGKNIWKGVVLEILLEPTNPESDEPSKIRRINYRDCISFMEGDNDPDRVLSLDELFIRIDKLRNYEDIYKGAIEVTNVLKKEFKYQYKITLLKVIDYDENYFREFNETEAESEKESEEDVEEESESEEEDFEEEWESEWESDSGVESPAESEEHSFESDTVTDDEYDSGLQTDSDVDQLEPEWHFNRQSSDSETDNEEILERNQEYHSSESDGEDSEDLDSTLEFLPEEH